MAEELVNIAVRKLNELMEQEVSLLDGVRDDIQKLKSSLDLIRAVLLDAEKREIEEEAVRLWLEKFKDLSYEMEDLLDEWSTEFHKSRIKHEERDANCTYFPSPCFGFKPFVHRRLVARFRKLNERLNMIAREKDAYNFKSTAEVAPPPPPHQEMQLGKFTSFINTSMEFGRDEEINDIVGMLCKNSHNFQETTPEIISIVGMAGIGKTTLAQRVYHDVKVKIHFEKRFWAVVSDPFNGVLVAKSIVESLDGDVSRMTELQTLLEAINRSIAGKKIMLVLDDVWTEDSQDLQPLLNALQGAASESKILITTRNVRVAKSIGSTCMHTLGALSESASWELFSSIALLGKSEKDNHSLKEVGRKIMEKCKGLPLALKIIGSHLRFKNTKKEWTAVLDSELWKLKVAVKENFSPLLLSYYDLPSAIKRCFLYCAIFPKDHEIQPEMLIRLWMSQGYLNSKGGTDMEAIGQEYFDELMMRSFLQDVECGKADGKSKVFKMHDIVHDLAQFLTKSECMIVDVGKMREQTTSLSSFKKLRHLTISRATRIQDITDILDTENLHTLRLSKVPKFDYRKLIGCIRFVRVLDLSKNWIICIPKELGELKLLRYLDLSYNDFRILPEAICGLYNLETLRMQGCRRLEELPKGIGKLVRLQHLELDLKNTLKVFPKGIGKIASLRTLSYFTVSKCEDTSAANIALLGRLKSLRGSFRIHRLENVQNRREALNAELKIKTKIIDLVLKFSPEKGNNQLDVIEGLEPPSVLEKLEISDYVGTRLPHWIMSLSKLRALKLHNCYKCEHLPPLGKLVSLESLVIQNSYLKRIDEEWLGITVDSDITMDALCAKEEESTTMRSSQLISFPKLEYLSFRHLWEWEEWEGLVVAKEIEENLKVQFEIFPSLHRLEIAGCEKLKALPDYIQRAPLQELALSGSPILQDQWRPDGGKGWSNVSHIPNIVLDNGFRHRDRKSQFR